MIKFSIVLLSLLGACFIFTSVVPIMWVHGFFVKGVFIPYAFPALGAIGFLGMRLKGK